MVAILGAEKRGIMGSAKYGITFLLTCILGLPAAYAAQEAQAKASTIQHVFVIAMENHDASQIIGNPGNAPYINNTLLPSYAQAFNFNDELRDLPSEPHYLWIEAGTNDFSDPTTFKTDEDPSRANSTASTAHLVTQIRNATNGVTWMTYQEGQNSKTGSCPIASSKLYAAKHNPFVFFQDVSGRPPSKTNVYCSAHSKPFSSLAADLAANSIASYVFITPNLCHDMHGALRCPFHRIKAGDDWLKSQLPPIIAWANDHHGVIFITWDEGENTGTMPFLAIGPGVKGNHYASCVSFNHGSIIKSVEKIFNLPILDTVTGNNDLSDLFESGSFP